jgi:predicted nucleic acid-binding protein
MFAAQADLVVSGDQRHLLALGSFKGIPIVTAAEAVRKTNG